MPRTGPGPGRSACRETAPTSAGRGSDCGCSGRTPASSPLASCCAVLLYGFSLATPPQRWLHLSARRAMPLRYHYVAVPQLDIFGSRSVANSAYRVQLGEKRIFDQSRNQTFSSVKRIVPHPNFNSSTLLADIALVELEKPIAFTATIKVFLRTTHSQPVELLASGCYAGQKYNSVPKGIRSIHGG
uniref:Peptidase S1 domain-containing protein n=1 Tax=Chelydra serpentina TaxID=8475 RepID=A0A8C3XVJ6_CHESE